MTGAATRTVGAATDSDPHRKSVRAAGRRRGPMATQLHVRGFGFASDEPLAVGGTDTAPTPMELVAGAVNGCIAVVVETIANERGLLVTDIETASKAHMDVRGFRGSADVSPHFLDYELQVRVTSSATEAQARALAREAEKRCPAVNLIRDAGVALEVIWEFRKDEFRPGHIAEGARTAARSSSSFSDPAVSAT
jgi:uncharacterized OsmC-like protein